MAAHEVLLRGTVRADDHADAVARIDEILVAWDPHPDAGWIVYIAASPYTAQNMSGEIAMVSGFNVDWSANYTGRSTS